ncbi:MAG: tRNA (guanosine(46)-N7)-methyltransferase TrmB, partial [Gammaproteobacteria bacterium]|nr:tRNA (guanosine(46)-N7)-methyltransferase TrmB [Gammaproteobacteria bacterium]
MCADGAGGSRFGPAGRPRASLVPGSPGVRSFARRGGRLTTGQRRAIERLWPRYGIDDWARLDLTRAFGRRAPVTAEIGFGMADALATMAERHPEGNYLGIEVYRPGIGAALRAIEARALENVRLVSADAVAVLDALDEGSLAAALVFFPDPWPKKRHHKRRLIQAPFVDLIATRLRPGGRFELATDWQPYAVEMLRVIESQGGFVNLGGEHGFAAGPSQRPPTKFERR